MEWHVLLDGGNEKLRKPVLSLASLAWTLPGGEGSKEKGSAETRLWICHSRWISRA